MKKNNMRQEWQGVRTMMGPDKINHLHGDDYLTFLQMIVEIRLKV